MTWTLLVIFVLFIPPDPSARVDIGNLQKTGLASESKCDEEAVKANAERPPGTIMASYQCIPRSSGLAL